MEGREFEPRGRGGGDVGQPGRYAPDFSGHVLAGIPGGLPELKRCLVCVNGFGSLEHVFVVGHPPEGRFPRSLFRS